MVTKRSSEPQSSSRFVGCWCRAVLVGNFWSSLVAMGFLVRSSTSNPAVLAYSIVASAPVLFVAIRSGRSAAIEFHDDGVVL
jgi:hypothetical protein